MKFLLTTLDGKMYLTSSATIRQLLEVLLIGIQITELGEEYGRKRSERLREGRKWVRDENAEEIYPVIIQLVFSNSSPLSLLSYYASQSTDTRSHSLAVNSA
jgi:hypothetical protein